MKPALVVAMGVRAAQSVFGKTVPVGKNRGRVVELEGETRPIVTIHPSYLLRMEEADREREFARFVADLKRAAPFAHRRRRAA